MSLSDVIGEYPVEWSHGEVYNAIQARTVTKYGTLAGARLQGILVGWRLLPLVKAVANTEPTSDLNENLFQGICIGLMSRFEPDGEIDFGDADNTALLDGFFANADVVSRLTTIGLTTQDAKDFILSKCAFTEPEFVNLTLKDVIMIREPSLATNAVSSPIVSNGVRTFAVTISDLPEPVTPVIEIRHHVPVGESEIDTEWRGTVLSGFANLSSGVYRVTLPTDLISPKFSIRVRIPYNAFVSIEII